MNADELQAVCVRYPVLGEWFLENPVETLRIIERVLVLEAADPLERPVLPLDAPDWERAYWERRQGSV